MVYQKSAFNRFSPDSGRVIANLEAAYEQWLDAKRQLAKLPVSMFWRTVRGSEYLGVKINSNSNGTTGGARSAETEAEYEQFHRDKDELKAQVERADQLIHERAGLYRSMRLPVLADRQGELLRALDVESVLRHDLLVVGTNAFCAYELLCGAKFPTGNEETEDFDLAWCRGTRVSLATTKEERRRTILQVLQGVDSSYRINPEKKYQAVNKEGYEVKLLAAPSLAPLPEEQAFEPMNSLLEQEWLLNGNPVAFVVATVRRRACPVYVPDPRWMAVHKLWLSRKPERRASKRPKDKRQGEVLLDACRYFLADTYPLNVDFVFELPAELQDLFDVWATERGYDPTKPDSGPEDVPPASRRFKR